MIPLTSLFLVKDFTTKKCEEKIIKWSKSRYRPETYIYHKREEN
jgi:hypothetical protein